MIYKNHWYFGKTLIIFQISLTFSDKNTDGCQCFLLVTLSLTAKLPPFWKNTPLNTNHDFRTWYQSLVSCTYNFCKLFSCNSDVVTKSAGARVLNDKLTHIRKDEALTRVNRYVLQKRFHLHVPVRAHKLSTDLHQCNLHAMPNACADRSPTKRTILTTIKSQHPEPKSVTWNPNIHTTAARILDDVFSCCVFHALWTDRHVCLHVGSTNEVPAQTELTSVSPAVCMSNKPTFATWWHKVCFYRLAAAEVDVRSTNRPTSQSVKARKKSNWVWRSLPRWVNFSFSWPRRVGS